MTTRRIWFIILSVALLAALLPVASVLGGASLPSGVQPIQQAETQPAASLRLVRSDAQGIVLELDTPTFSIVYTTLDSTLYHVVSVPGLTTSGEAGRPGLPVKGTLLGIPLGVDIDVRVLEAETEVLSGRYRIAPAPHETASEDEMGWAYLVGRIFVEDGAVYGHDRFYPVMPVQVTATGHVRNQRVARVGLYPFQFNPVTGQLVHHRHLKVALDFKGAAPLAPERDTSNDARSFEMLLGHTLLNYESARSWRASPAGTPPLLAAAQEGEDLVCKIVVEEDGVYEISYADLQDAGWDAGSIDPRSLQMYNQGQEIAITVVGQDDGSFDMDDTVRFCGQGLETKYASTNVYWLTTGTSSGRRVQDVDGHPSDPVSVAEAFSTTIRAEQDRVYWAAPSPSSGGDYWFWERLWATPGSPMTVEYRINLPSLAVGTFTTTLRVAVKSRYDEPAYDPDHHLRLYLNGYLVEDTTWDGEVVQLMTSDLPQSILVDGINIVQIALPGDLGVPFDAIYLDWFEINYYRTYRADGDRLAFTTDRTGVRRFEISGFSQPDIEVYDVSQPAAVSRLVSGTIVPMDDTYTLQFQATITSSRQYLALTRDQIRGPASITLDIPSALRSPANGADYLIITHADFYAAAETLADYRAGQGLRVTIVDIQDVYDEFSYGILKPEAIQSFLAYAYAYWQQPAPSYVLLMGDGHLDFHDNLGIGEANFIPPYLGQVDRWLGETASDNRYVTVSGDDLLPDMHIGRLPVSSPSEASALVAKIIRYEQASSPGPCKEQALFVADNAEGGDDFAASADAIAQCLPASFEADRVYYGVTHTVPSEATDAIIRNINEGRLLVNYVGHGAVQFWAAEHLFEINNISTLTNTDALPLILSWTCYDGLFDYPGYPSLGESIIRAQGRGAVASWSPSGLGLPAAHEILAGGFYRAVFTDGLHLLGPATTQAKLSLWAQAPEFQELIDTYLLLGDPATELALPRPRLSIVKTASADVVQPGDLLTYTIFYSNTGDARATGVIITETYDPHTSFVRATPPPDQEDMVWDIDGLEILEAGAITVTVQVGEELGYETLTNTITIRCNETRPEVDTVSHRLVLIPYQTYLPLVLRSRDTLQNQVIVP
ncbi:MAG TPA: C25 family cysteine peptidase [Anaerolineae bacterium]|nr:C25 family cysteine peptidase [Anaerolineae bacterium]